MLEKYKNDNKIMMVSGMNWAGEWKADQQDYYFSALGGVWGWATWRRAWELLDPEMKQWKDRETRKKIKEKIGNNKQYWARRYLFNIGIREKKWEYQWAFFRTFYNGLAIFPSRNLIANIGFGPEATHTKTLMPQIEKLERQELNFPLKNNGNLVVDKEYDKIIFSIMHSEFNHSWPVIFLIKIWRRIISKLK
ncbi:MAG: hypothetical protein WC531_00080 [Candidatus Paceibacterota bacterium]